MARVREGNKREELIKAAKYLFMTEGIDEVPVSKIVKKAGVAQGTFYLYFDSKEAILDAVASQIADGICKEVLKTSEQKLNALDKLLKIKELFFNFADQPDEVVSHFHGDEHKEAHARLSEAVIFKITPIFEKIVKQGVKEGLFKVSYPAQTAKILITIASHEQALYKDKKALEKWDKAVTEFMLRGLGVKSRN